MKTLTNTQKELLNSLSTSYRNGLPPSSSSLSAFPTTTNNNEMMMNKLKPPLNCPSWACILLPCINHIPSMKLFQTINPSDAEVLRGNNNNQQRVTTTKKNKKKKNDRAKWIFYDAISLKVGDIIRLNEGDLIPADCVILSLGMDHYDDDNDGKINTDNGDVNMDNGGLSLSSPLQGMQMNNDEEQQVEEEGGGGGDELVVDNSNITGQKRPKTISYSTIHASSSSSSSSPMSFPNYSDYHHQTISPLEHSKSQHPLELYCGSFILHGCAIAVVVRIGTNTCLGSWIQEGTWPPTPNSFSNDDVVNKEEVAALMEENGEEVTNIHEDGIGNPGRKENGIV